ncbi:hypothetical protein [Thermofilum sp.]|uniref:hypothetical protein n=1 Tax=Thermofilum sp. TaxID=1961369 RepID=UPI002587998C|nr:hypothetical protein [Thermofilum sp.]
MQSVLHLPTAVLQASRQSWYRRWHQSMHLLLSHGFGREIMSRSDFLGSVTQSARGAYALL